MQPKVVALGGGHGLSATLSSLRSITPNITAIVTVADNGGSSGRLRKEFPILPPGDLRMALAALCGDDEWGREWARLMQHRFTSSGELSGHSVGNLILAALWDREPDPVVGLDRVGLLLRVVGRVLPMSSEPLAIEATFLIGDRLQVVRGQVEVATTKGKVVSLRLIPENPPARPEAIAAIGEADWIIMGPGSWFSSVLPHLMVPDQRRAICESSAQRIIVLNLDAGADSHGDEYAGYTPEDHLYLIQQYAPDLIANYIVVDPSVISDAVELENLRKKIIEMGGELVFTDVRKSATSVHHDIEKLTRIFGNIMTDSLIG